MAESADDTKEFPGGILAADDLFDSLDDLEIDVLIDDDGEPTLLDAEGHPVETWREGYPYDTRMTRLEYERTKRLLQIELLKLQSLGQGGGPAADPGLRGPRRGRQGGHDPPLYRAPQPAGRPGRGTGEADRDPARPVVLPALCRTAAVGRGDRVLRPVLVQPRWRRARDGLLHRRASTTGSSSQAPAFERMLVEDGIDLIKFWFSVTQSEQCTRFTLRRVDPVKQWKLSPMDLASLDKWEAYTAAKEQMFRSTHTSLAPWTVVKSNDKRRGRIESMRYVLSRFDYPGKAEASSVPPTRCLLGPPDEVLEDR